MGHYGHIKIFEDFESESDRLQTLRDICVDIRDEGFACTFHESVIKNPEILKICPDLKDKRSNFINIYKPHNETSQTHESVIHFKISDVKETTDRIKNYLGDRLNCCVFGLSYNAYTTNMSWSSTMPLRDAYYLEKFVASDDDIWKVIVIYNNQ